MLFNSFQYAIFLPVIFIVYWGLPNRFQWVVLLLSSYYFYMSWNARYVILILFTTVVSYVAARMIETHRKHRKIILATTLISCLGVLFVFKYFNFAIDIINNINSIIGIKLHFTTLRLLLPVGISFYTFQTLSYVIDVYRGDVVPERHFGIYATFISFFPQLVAGPIERTSNLLPQIKAHHKFNYEQATYGLMLMAWGFFKKLAIADVVSVYVDQVYTNIGRRTGFDLFVAIIFFTFQIYCDFSGYSDIAIGSAKLMGIELMTNFKSPYFASSIQDFWRRWHISLSTWFRDYVYIPLGGNRCSKMRQQVNLMITFLISGLWHGANWTFILWGGVHSLGQIVEKKLNIKRDSMAKEIVFGMLTFGFCNIAWVLFRAQNVSDFGLIISRLFGFILTPGAFLQQTIGLGRTKLAIIFIAIIILSIYDFISLKTDVINLIRRQNGIIRWSIYVGFIWVTWSLMEKTGSSEFVYFQF